MTEDEKMMHAASAEVLAEFPLSTTQQRCWFLNQMQPGNPALNVAVRWEVKGNLKATSLERAFQNVIERHEILRTRFVEIDSGPVQQVLSAARFKLDSIDLQRLDSSKQKSKIEQIAHEVALRAFDLGKAGLIRALLIRLAADHAMIVFVVHQTCFDGFSIRVLGHEIGTAAQAFERDEQPDLPDLDLQYGDFSLWQAEYLASNALEEEVEYWLSALSDAPYFEVTPDNARPRIKGTDVNAVSLDLSPEFGGLLTNTAKRLGVSNFTFGTAIFSACLARITGQSDVSFGTQIAGRLDTDLDPLIGVFINNIVLRFQADPHLQFDAHVSNAKAVIEGALSHQMMPFNTLVERLNPPRDPSRTPLISVNFNLQDVFMESKSYGGFELVSSPSHAPGAIYDLDLAVMGRPSGWQLNLEYASALFDRATAEAILTLMQNAFQSVFQDPTQQIASLRVPQALVERDEVKIHSVTAVEAALLSQRYVRDVAVLQDGERFFAFVVLGDTGTTPLEALPQKIIDACADDPALAGLTGVSLLGALPRTSRGEVNRSLLQVPTGLASEGALVAIDQDVVSHLKQDWCDILSIPAASSDGHFFDLGGHSVLVLRQLSRIRERWDVKLDVTAVYENPTLTDLARVISARLASVPELIENDWRYMTLAPKGEGQQLIAINNAATGLALASAGAAPREVYCARVVDGDRGLVLDEQTFEDIASKYADVIRKGQPTGPYLLYGNCVHGNLALEVARQLQTNGSDIAGVVMKDVWEPAYTQHVISNPKTKRREKWHALRNRLDAVRSNEMSWGTFFRFYGIARKTGFVWIGEKLGLFQRTQSSDLDEQQEQFVSFVSGKRDAYRPSPINFPVLHIVTKSTPQSAGFKSSIGWEDIVDPNMLKTVHLDKVLVLHERRIGVDAMAAEIDAFLSNA